MTVCFVANQYQTILTRAISRRLEAEGERVVWISPSRRWSDYLASDGVPATTVLNIPDYRREWSFGRTLTSGEAQWLEDVECAGNLTVNNIVLMDRLLRYRQPAYARAYVAVVAREVARFVREHDVEVALGEGTWAAETTTALVCRALNRGFFSPSTVRLPCVRSAFFVGVKQEAVFEFGPPTAAHREAARDFLADLATGGSQPHYIANTLKLVGFRRYWWREAVITLASPGLFAGDETVPGLPMRAGLRLREFVWRRLARRGRVFEPIPAPPRAPFVLLLLHKQPESSIDVVAGPFTNQFESIRTMAQLLPAGCELYVKEHAVAVGDRGPGFYAALRRVPGVRLIDPGADTKALIREARLTVAPSGTAAFEAGLMGRPGATFVKIFFGPLLAVNGLNPYDWEADSFARLIDAPRVPSETERVDFLAWLLAQSFEGEFIDPVSLATSIEAGNVEALARACLRLLCAWRTVHRGETKEQRSTTQPPDGSDTRPRRIFPVSPQDRTRHDQR